MFSHFFFGSPFDLPRSQGSSTSHPSQRFFVVSIFRPRTLLVRLLPCGTVSPPPPVRPVGGGHRYCVGCTLRQFAFYVPPGFLDLLTASGFLGLARGSNVPTGCQSGVEPPSAGWRRFFKSPDRFWYSFCAAFGRCSLLLRAPPARSHGDSLFAFVFYNPFFFEACYCPPSSLTDVWNNTVTSNFFESSPRLEFNSSGRRCWAGGFSRGFLVTRGSPGTLDQSPLGIFFSGLFGVGLRYPEAPSCGVRPMRNLGGPTCFEVPLPSV